MKKIVKVLGILTCAAVLFFNVSLSEYKSSNSMNLSSMTKINEANAECAPSTGFFMGECQWGDCWFSPRYYECDPAVR